MSSEDDSGEEYDESHFDELLSVLAKIRVYVEMIEKRVMSDTSEGSEDDSKLIEGVQLRDYQRKGVSWILTLYENGMNGILADEMGLGKTIQIIAALAALIEAGVPGPYLIITPLSLLSSWADQFSAFAPRIPCLVYYGAMIERLKLRKRIRKRIRISLNDPIETKALIAPSNQPNHSTVTAPSTLDSDSLLSCPMDTSTMTSTACASLTCSATESVCSFPSHCSVEDRRGRRVQELQMDPEALSRVDDTISRVLQTTNTTEDLAKDGESSLYQERSDKAIATKLEASENDSTSNSDPLQFVSFSSNSPPLNIGFDNPAECQLPLKTLEVSPGIRTDDTRFVESLELDSCEPSIAKKELVAENDCPSVLCEKSLQLSQTEHEIPEPLKPLPTSEPNPEPIDNTDKDSGFLHFKLLTSESSDQDAFTTEHLPLFQSDTDPTIQSEEKSTMSVSQKVHTSSEALSHLDDVITEVLLHWTTPDTAATLVNPSLESTQAVSNGPPQIDSQQINGCLNHNDDLGTALTEATSNIPIGEDAQLSSEETAIDTESVNVQPFNATTSPLSSQVPDLCDGTLIQLPKRLADQEETSAPSELDHHDDTFTPSPQVDVKTELDKQLALTHLDEVITQVLASWDENRSEIDKAPMNTELSIKPEETMSSPNCIPAKLDDENLFSKPESSNASTITCSESTASRRKLNDDVFWAYPIVLTSYEVAIRDAKYLQKVPFKGLIIDEGQRLKNPASRLYKRLAKFSTGLRILVTGTPLQNRISELWALLHFILPEIFTSLEMFEHWFDPVVLTDHAGRDRLVTAEMERSLITKLHCIISPFMLRRSKAETNLLLPPKREILLRVGMTPLQTELYKQALKLCLESQNNQLAKRPSKDGVQSAAQGGQGSLTWLDQANILPDASRGTNKNTNRRLTRNASRTQLHEQRRTRKSTRHEAIEPAKEPQAETPPVSSSDYEFLISPRASLSNGLMLLRRIANHPYLAIDRPEPTVHSDGDAPLRIPSDDQLALINASDKTRLLDRLLKQLIEDKHKVLIFSQLTIVLDVLEELLVARNWPFVRLDGATKFADRQEAIKRFNYEPVEDLPVFLVSARAGGCGLNLQAAADTVVIFDSDWNPQTDLQAQDRCHRIGQTKPVLVIRLVTAGTIDETILERAHAKRGLERLVLAGGSYAMNPRKRSPCVNNKPFLGHRKHGWLLRRQSRSTESSLSKTELLRLLAQKDYHSEVSDLDGLSDEALEKLLDRSDLHLQWERQKVGDGVTDVTPTFPQNSLESSPFAAQDHVALQMDLSSTSSERRLRGKREPENSPTPPSPKRTRSGTVRCEKRVLGSNRILSSQCSKDNEFAASSDQLNFAVGWEPEP